MSVLVTPNNVIVELSSIDTMQKNREGTLAGKEIEVKFRFGRILSLEVDGDERDTDFDEAEFYRLIRRACTGKVPASHVCYKAIFVD